MDSNTLRVCFVFRIVLRICGWLCNMQQLQHKCWANVTWPLWHMWQQQQQQHENFCCPDLTFVHYVSAALIVPPTALGRGNNCATRAQLHCYYWQWQVSVCVSVCASVSASSLSRGQIKCSALFDTCSCQRGSDWSIACVAECVCVCFCHCVSVYVYVGGV